MCRNYFLTFRKTNIISTHVTMNILTLPTSITSCRTLYVVMLLWGIISLGCLVHSTLWTKNRRLWVTVGGQNRSSHPRKNNSLFRFVYAFNKHGHKRIALWPKARLEEASKFCWGGKCHMLRCSEGHLAAETFPAQRQDSLRDGRAKRKVCALLCTSWYIKCCFCDTVATANVTT